MFGMSFLASRKSWLTLLLLAMLSLGMLAIAPQVHAASSRTSLVCSPTWSKVKLPTFPNPGNLLHVSPPGGCSSHFLWAPSIFQATNGNTDPNAAATAQWTANIGPSSSCTIQAFIPDIDAGADAQYYIWDGGNYKANTVLNQENATGWTTIFSGGFSNGARVTLDNVTPNPNKTNWDDAAYAVQFICAV